MAGRVHLCEYLIDAAVREATDASSLPLFRCRGAATSAAEARRRVAALAAAFSHQLCLQLGDRVCLAALSTPAHLEALLAVTAAGCIAAPLNWRWSAEEAAHAAGVVSASAVVADAACAPLACQVAAACPTVTTLILLGARDEYAAQSSALSAPPGVRVVFAEALIAECSAAASQRPSTPRWAPDDAALAVFTSGTTGRPRAALLSHGAMHFQCQAKLRCCGYRRGDVYLHAAPLFHVGGLCSALAMLLAGAAHVFLPTFSAAAALGAIEQHAVTSFIAVPTMAADLVAAAAPGAVYYSVRTVLVGAGGLPPPLSAALGKLFPGATLLSAYGMTEACSSLTFHTLRAPGGPSDAAPSGSQGEVSSSGNGVYVGRPPLGIELGVLPHCESVLEGSQLAAVVAAEGSGEVVTRGPHVMLRYWGDEAATKACLTPGGWFRTGDLGQLHQGGLWLLGRAKDVVKSGGENVAAWEVERCLATHAAVAAAAVVGLPDPRLGEAVAAAVVLAPGWTWVGLRFQALPPGGSAPTACNPDLSEPPDFGSSARSAAERQVDGAALQRHCRLQGLAGFKLPRVVAVVDLLPVNATGKVVKAEVKRALALQQSAEQRRLALPGAPPALRARL